MTESTKDIVGHPRKQKTQLPAVVPGAALCTIGSGKSNYTGGLLQCQRFCETGVVLICNIYCRFCWRWFNADKQK